MGLLDNILAGENSGAISQIAKSLGIPESMAQQAAGALAPALSRGLERNAKKPGGLEDLLDPSPALRRERQSRRSVACIDP